MSTIWLAFEVTGRCNLDCDFCYNLWRGKPLPSSDSELSSDEITVLANSLMKTDGVKGITLTGGEPLLRDDICEIVETFTTRGIATAVATNGHLLSDTLARELVSAGVIHFDIGFTDPCEKTVLAVANCVRTGRTVTASLCITGQNYMKTGTRVRTASALGADSVCLNRFIPTGKGRINESSLNLETDSLLKALELAQQACESCPVNIYTGIPIDPSIATADDFPCIDFTTCRCGETKWAINTYGSLRTCEQNGRILGSLLQTDLHEILKRRSVEIQEFRKMSPYRCRFQL